MILNEIAMKKKTESKRICAHKLHEWSSALLLLNTPTIQRYRLDGMFKFANKHAMRSPRFYLP